jgi:hypothetical protein
MGTQDGAEDGRNRRKEQEEKNWRGVRCCFFSTPFLFSSLISSPFTQLHFTSISSPGRLIFLYPQSVLDAAPVHHCRGCAEILKQSKISEGDEDEEEREEES